jgi:putative acetyltransferase
MHKRQSAALFAGTPAIKVVGSGRIDILQVTTPQQFSEIRQLFSEYFEWIRADLHLDMSYQNVQAELAALPGYYAPPRGRLLLARTGDAAAACVALRPMKDEGACELKRMYVRPPYRGQGLGRTLGERIIAEAKQIGYRLMRLDTHESLTNAITLYTSLGFHHRSAYFDVPPDVLSWCVFMEMPLG